MTTAPSCHNMLPLPDAALRTMRPVNADEDAAAVSMTTTPSCHNMLPLPYAAMRTMRPVIHFPSSVRSCNHLTLAALSIHTSAALSLPPYRRGDRDNTKFLISKSKSEVFSSTSSSRRRGEELGQQSHQNCLRLQRLCWGVAV